MKYKILSIVIISVVILSNFSLSAICDSTDPTITVGSASGTPGQLVEVPISLSGCEQFTSLSVEVSFDTTKLKLVNVTSKNTGATFTGPQISKNPLTLHPLQALPMPCPLTWFSLKNVNYNGVLALLTFEIISDNFNESIDISVDFYKGPDGKNEDGKSVNFYSSGGGSTGVPVERHPLGLKYSGGNITVLYEETDMSVSKVTSADNASYDLNVNLSGKAYTGTVYIASYNPTGKIKTLDVYYAAKKIILKDISSDVECKVFWWDNSTMTKMVND